MKPIKKMMFNRPKMVIISTRLDLTTKSFLLVFLKRVLRSRFVLSSDKLSTQKDNNELKLFSECLLFNFNKKNNHELV